MNQYGQYRQKNDNNAQSQSKHLPKIEFKKENGSINPELFASVADNYAKIIYDDKK